MWCLFQTVLVHTPDTICLTYFMDLLLQRGKPIMLVGTAGVGKTILVSDKVAKLMEDFMVAKVPFNYYTTSAMLQRKNHMNESKYVFDVSAYNILIEILQCHFTCHLCAINRQLKYLSIRTGRTRSRIPFKGYLTNLFCQIFLPYTKYFAEYIMNCKIQASDKMLTVSACAVCHYLLHRVVAFITVLCIF